MTHELLDHYFPYFVFYYGFIMTVFLNTSKVQKLAEKHIGHEQLKQMHMHRGLALVCLFVGAFWSLQSLWFY